MSGAEDDRDKLRREDPQFRRLWERHAEYQRRLDELAARRFPSDEEKAEATRLKKLKLALKDEMEQILRNVRA
jgi:hypothetical protein